jgi:hypothetical protein
MPTLDLMQMFAAPNKFKLDLKNRERSIEHIHGWEFGIPNTCQPVRSLLRKGAGWSWVRDQGPR